MVKRIYSDCNCLFLESEVDYTTFSECQEASYGAASSRHGFCSTGSSDIPSQMAGTLLSYYDDQICEEAPLDYELFATNICVDLSFLSPNSSLRSEYQTCSNSGTTEGSTMNYHTMCFQSCMMLCTACLMMSIPYPSMMTVHYP